MISKEVKELCDDMILNNKSWNQSRHTFDKKDTNVSIWVSNGIPFIDFYPEIKAFNLMEKIYIHRYIKKSIIKSSCSNKDEVS